MTAYAVYEEKNARHLPLDERVEELAFVKDGFHWGAFVLSGIWLAIKGHWLALVIWAAALIIGGALIWLLGLGEEALVWLWLASALLVGLEAGGLERDKLEAADAQEIAFVSGSSRADYEGAAVARLASIIQRERQDSGSADA